MFPSQHHCTWQDHSCRLLTVERYVFPPTKIAKGCILWGGRNWILFQMAPSISISESHRNPLAIRRIESWYCCASCAVPQLFCTAQTHFSIEWQVNRFLKIYGMRVSKFDLRFNWCALWRTPWPFWRYFLLEIILKLLKLSRAVLETPCMGGNPHFLLSQHQLGNSICIVVNDLTNCISPQHERVAGRRVIVNLERNRLLGASESDERWSITSQRSTIPETTASLAKRVECPALSGFRIVVF